MSIFSKSFWLGGGVTMFNLGDWILTGIFIGFAVLAIIARILKATGKNAVLNRLYGRIFSGLLIFAIIGGLWAELRNLLVPYLGSRITAGLILLCFLVWLGFILRHVLSRLAKEKSEWEAQQVKNRYLNSRS